MSITRAANAAALTAAQHDRNLLSGGGYATVAAMLADGTNYGWAEGQIIAAGEFRYQVAASGANDQHVTTAGGVRLYVLPHNGGYNVLAFGATPTRTASSTAAIVAAISAAAAAPHHPVIVPPGDYNAHVVIPSVHPRGITFTGAGKFSTRFWKETDDVGVIVNGRSDLSGFAVRSDIGDTTDGIQLRDFSRGRLGEVEVNGMGRDGLQYWAGQMAHLWGVIMLRSNARDGLRAIYGPNSGNAVHLDCVMDCLVNGGIGFHMEEGDGSFALQKSNWAGGIIVCQSNGDLGFKIGTDRNNLMVYGESNGTTEIIPAEGILYGAARGNVIVTNNGTFLNQGDERNQIYRRDGTTSNMMWDQVRTNTIRLELNELAGRLEISHHADRVFRITGSSSAGSHIDFGGIRGMPTHVRCHNQLIPASDNAQPLGTSAQRWSEVFAGNATINTSDEREKQDIEELTEAERRVARKIKGLLKKFRWKTAVEAKRDAARIHVGVIAQELAAAFESEGLDPERYGMFTRNIWWEVETVTEVPSTDDNGNEVLEQRREIVAYDSEAEAPQGSTRRERLGVRYDQLLAFILAAL